MELHLAGSMAKSGTVSGRMINLCPELGSTQNVGMLSKKWGWSGGVWKLGCIRAKDLRNVRVSRGFQGASL